MRRLSKKFGFLVLAATMVAAGGTNSFAQTWPTAPPASPERPAPRLPRGPSTAPAIFVGAQETHERSIKVDPGVNLYFGCVLEGSIRVNGWNRNEVRVFVANGPKFAYRIAQKSQKTGEPVWIKVIGSGGPRRAGPESECLSGSEIEVDAPVGATITIKGRAISTNVDTVKKADVESIGGSISLRNVASGISANAGQGDITVEASQGPMSLDTTTGNILVFEAGPSDIGDTFQAKTNSGAIALQRIDHRQINVGSISGSVAYTGSIVNGGSYNLRTLKGSIRLTIPVASSFQMWATYGFGNFSTDIPVDIVTENFEGPVKSIRGKAKTGDATLKLTTNNGSISIKKL